jgi:hypothetical protein
LMDISDSMLRSPSKSLRKLAQEKDIGLATAHKAARTQICIKFLRIKLNVFRLVYTLLDITSNTFYKCTANFRTHCSKLLSMNHLYLFIIYKTCSIHNNSNLFLPRRFGRQPPSSGRIYINIKKT